MTTFVSLDQIPSLGAVIAALDQLYPPRLAESWDHVGLSVGRRANPVQKILFALDPVEAVIDEALDWDADLIVTHHPFFFNAVHSVSDETDRGELVHRLIEAKCGLFAAHTNADSASRGVNDALADLLGIEELMPLVPATDPNDLARGLGLGRVGRLARPMTLKEFAGVVAHRLPKAAQGIRVSGDLAAMVETVAVLGGSGESLASAAAESGADVYVTSDMKHHGALDLRAAFDHSARLGGKQGPGRPFLIDTAHFASESPWLKYAQEDVGQLLKTQGFTIQTKVSRCNTDPWTIRL